MRVVHPVVLHTYQIRDENFGLMLVQAESAETALRHFVAMKRSETVDVFTDPEGIGFCEFEGHTLYAVPRVASS